MGLLDSVASSIEKYFPVQQTQNVLNTVNNAIQGFQSITQPFLHPPQIVQDIGKNIIQGTTASAARLASPIIGPPPSNGPLEQKINQALFGSPSLPSFSQYGENTLTGFGVPKSAASSLAFPAGVGLSLLDVSPLGGEEKAAKTAATTTLENFDAAKYVAEQVAKQQEAKTVLGSTSLSKIYSFLNEAKSKLVDFAAPIEDTLKKAQKTYGFESLPQFDISNQIDRVLKAPTIAGQFIRDHGLDQVVKSVDNLQNLDQYLIAKQATNVAQKGIETGRNLIKDKALIEAFAPQYEPAAKVVTDYSKKLLDYATQSGLVSQDLANKLKEIYPDYVPLNRIFNELEKSGGYGTRAVASLSKQTAVQKLVGSTREIQSPIYSLYEKTADIFNQGEKNKAARILASFKDIPTNPFQIQELGKGESGVHTFSYLDNGIKRTFTTTPDIANAAKALNVQQLNILGKIFALPTRLAKVGITGINLPFIASNIAKDQVTGFINSDNALRTSIANPAVFTKSLFEAVGHGKLYDEMARQGALGTSFDIARNQVIPTIEKLRAGRTALGKVAYTVKHPSELLRAVENIVGRGEELTRIQHYAGTKQGLLKKGMTEANAQSGAAQAARNDTVNFARRGEWGQVLNSAFLYLNASIQGTRTFLRNLKEKPLQTATKIGLSVFTPIAAATAWNLSDPQRKAAYDDIADYEKQNNIVIVPPNPTKNKDGTWNVIKIPLSQEINNLASLARRPIEQAFGLDPVAVKDIASAFIGSISPINPTTGSLLSTLTPQAIRPTIEGITNKNLFTGFNQVPASLQNLSPELQVKPTTSGTARKIGGALKVSPIKVEEWIKGTLGGVGSQVLHASDLALANLNIIPKDQIGGQSVLKAIVARFNQARGGQTDQQTTNLLQDAVRKSADENFRLKQEAEILNSEFQKLSPEEANQKANELKTKNPALYAELKTVVQQSKLNLDYNDRLLLQLGVNNGSRAQFIWSVLQTLPTPDAKNQYINDLRSKKIVSDKVFQQLQQLKGQ